MRRSPSPRIRAQATRTYSDAWDESGRRQLLRLLANAQRGLIAPERPRGWSLRRRPVTAGATARSEGAEERTGRQAAPVGHP